MPVVSSFALANNKGGSGKTFLLFQLACDVARAQPSRKVLVVDFSLYSDTSGLFLGGLRRKGPLSSTVGRSVTDEKTTSDTRAEGMVRALVASASAQAQAAAPPVNLFGRFFRGLANPAQQQGPVNLETYMIQPSAHNAHIPKNLWLVPSAAENSWGNDTTGQGGDAMDVDQEVPFWARQHSKEWWPAAQELKKALAALSGEWIVFVDTDHLSAAPLTKLALGAVQCTVVPLSLDAGDFNRMFEDPTGNALFGSVLMPSAQQGMPMAPVRKFIFTKVSSQTNKETTTKEGTPLPFTPAKASMALMDQISDSLRNAAKEYPNYQPCLEAYVEEFRGEAFAAKYFTAFKTVTDLSANASKNFGAPLCTMRSNDQSLGSTDQRPDKNTLNSLKVEVNSVVCSLLGATFEDKSNVE